MVDEGNNSIACLEAAHVVVVVVGIPTVPRVARRNTYCTTPNAGVTFDVMGMIRYNIVHY
jgi:hypothetical protein